MEIKRKVQFGAVAVIANGLLALSALDPGVALASSCPDLDVCLPFCNTEGINMYCQGSTPPGCTFVGTTCQDIVCGGDFPLLWVISTCHYQ
jgi:hypothetical protein